MKDTLLLIIGLSISDFSYAQSLKMEKYDATYNLSLDDSAKLYAAFHNELNSVSFWVEEVVQVQVGYGHVCGQKRVKPFGSSAFGNYSYICKSKAGKNGGVEAQNLFKKGQITSSMVTIHGKNIGCTASVNNNTAVYYLCSMNISYNGETESNATFVQF